ncbi:adenine methylase [Synergistales bacterium]|nr:adenine methylase [Synergistales bacterium]
MNHLPFPNKKYGVIYADPPWAYSDKGCNGAAAEHYPDMKLDDICALPVKSLAADNCVLFLWATYPLMKEALKTIEAWGFTYKSIAFQWVKTNRSGFGFFYGLGRWTRGNTEPCLLAVKGKPSRVSNSVSQLILSPVAQHSKKPDEARDRIVQLIGDLPRIELFARSDADGWDAWGDEVNINPWEVTK